MSEASQPPESEPIRVVSLDMRGQASTYTTSVDCLLADLEGDLAAAVWNLLAETLETGSAAEPEDEYPRRTFFVEDNQQGELARQLKQAREDLAGLPDAPSSEDLEVPAGGLDRLITRRRMIEIRYLGEPFRIDPVALAAWVATGQASAPWRGDPESGAQAESLFNDALAAGAVIVPAGLTAQVSGSDEPTEAIYMLAAYPEFDTADPFEVRAGVTTGWEGVESIAVEDSERASDLVAVTQALEVMVGDLNAALGLAR